MKCAICDRMLADAEIVFSVETGEYEPCSTCLSVIYDAAYSGGFSPDGPPLDLDSDNPTGAVPTLEPEVFESEPFWLDVQGDSE